MSDPQLDKMRNCPHCAFNGWREDWSRGYLRAVQCEHCNPEDKQPHEKENYVNVDFFHYGKYKSEMIAKILQSLTSEQLRDFTKSLALKITSTVGGKGMCLQHHEWDRTTISVMTCIHCGETTDTTNFV